ncbi:MAG: Protease HtpX [Pseudomonas citronellolis]|nr:MAG: Protease HtpX [Pseudomonas citronellolis]
MNFFEHQERARKQTGKLILLMALAVIALVSITSLVLGWLLHHLSRQPLPIDLSGTRLYGYIALTIIGVVVFGAYFKHRQLSAGGRVVAERLGGRLINLSASNLEERRLLNVVEEMAIASGSPVPAVYVLEERGINAFAAGMTPRDAVIGITREALRVLSRNELQGVIAHEFSHIHNGDMRLNMRLVALLHGILLIGLIGDAMLRGLYSPGDADYNAYRLNHDNPVNGGSDRDEEDERSRSAGFRANVSMLLIGVALKALGYTGTFFGELIKSAVTRQREFLADASAVQFTRDPSTIAGALKKIGGSALGSRLEATWVSEFSHLYFSDALGGSLFDSHPPLAERIRRVTPDWDGRYPKYEPPPVEVALLDSNAWTAALAGRPYVAKAAEQAVAAIGAPAEAHLDQARETLNSLGERLQRAAHDPAGAQALVYALLLEHDPALRSQQLTLLKSHLGLETALQLDLIEEQAQSLSPGQRLPLLDLAMPALRQLDDAARKTLLDTMVLLIKADGHVQLLEWTLLRIVQHNLRRPTGRIGNLPLESLADHAATLLAFLSQHEADSPELADSAFNEAWLTLGLPRRECPRALRLNDLESALKRLGQLRPLQKPRLLKAMARCIEADGRVSASEAELLRAVADMLDCPMPPLLISA